MEVLSFAELFLKPLSVTAVFMNMRNHFFLIFWMWREVGPHKQVSSVQHTSRVSCIMPTRISNDMKAHIPALHYEQGYSVKKICQLLAIRKTPVYKTLCLHHLHGTTHNPNVRRHSGPRRLTTTDHSFILALLNQQHTVYLDEIQEQLLLRRNVKVLIPTLTSQQGGHQT